MTVRDENLERIIAAAHTAKLAGRNVMVVTAGATAKSEAHAEIVILAFVDEVLSAPTTAKFISLPRRDAELLEADLHNALTGDGQTVEAAFAELSKKGPVA